MENIYRYIARTALSQKQFVKATVIFSEGSAPGKLGCSAVFTSAGLEYGTIGGGIVEERIRRSIIESWPCTSSRIYSFNLDNQTGNPEGAICGGRTEILADVSLFSEKQVLKKIKEYALSRTPVIVVSVLYYRNKDSVDIERYILSSDFIDYKNLPFGEEVANEARIIFSSEGKSVFKAFSPGFLPDGRKATVLLEAVFPPPRLVIAGAGHIGKALSHLGKFLGFEVTVIDDRAEYANEENLRDADEIIVNDIGRALAGISKDPSTYIVIVTRGHASDATALKACIGSRAAYIGMIGSKSKTEKIKRDFLNNGWATPEQWAEIHAPIGISINSKTVEEIAVSIAAELVFVKNSTRT